LLEKKKKKKPDAGFKAIAKRQVCLWVVVRWEALRKRFSAFACMDWGALLC
jgi:hypothetical protein